MSRYDRLSGGRPARHAEDQSRQARLRQASLAIVIVLIIQFALGISVNLYVTGHPGHASWFGNGPLLALHASLGMFLVLAAVFVLVRAIMARNPALIATSAAGLVAIGLSTAFRLILVIPIAIVLSAVNGWVLYVTVSSHSYGVTAIPAGAGGALVFGPLLMILFRRKYPRWWFDWNLELQRFINESASTCP